LARVLALALLPNGSPSVFCAASATNWMPMRRLRLRAGQG
jgi:hypothetical protein